jgi:hypothetical protein
VPAEENPGLVLGTILGVAASKGIDKLTLLASPGIHDLTLAQSGAPTIHFALSVPPRYRGEPVPLGSVPETPSTRK